MDRLLIVPAAGRGSRLRRKGPKALVPVAGRPMLEHLVDLHASSVDRIVVVAAPSARAAFEAFRATCRVPIDMAVQEEATGMLDAILCAGSIVNASRPRRVAITWCDQIAVAPATVAAVREQALAAPPPAMVLATVAVDRPYIHFDRDVHRCITAVRQRREGDAMPDHGESDMGLFDLSLESYLHDLPAFAADALASAGTGERNFLPFIPWLSARALVRTVAGMSPIEALGINTPEELTAVEAYLRQHREAV
jgi:bifunctional UDP-N-acetylglucosamine pyrophosphorylase / glucosamine-1-phosphate N-acetyltransferase